MTINYPTSLDSLTNPSATDSVATVDHATQHANANDAIEALEAKVGIDGSAVTTSHDYKLSEVTSTDKAVGKSASQVLTNKTLTSPKVGTAITDTNGNEIINTPATASAVNEVTVRNAATGNNPAIEASGGDSNVGIDLKSKGTGTVNIKGDGTQAGEIRIYEDSDDGTNYTAIKAQAQAGNVSYTLPAAQGAASSVLTNNGSGVLSWGSSSVTAVTTLTPQPNFYTDGAANDITATVNTTMRLGQIIIPFSITVNKVSFYVRIKTTNGTVKVALYSEDGQTKLFEFTTASITATGVVTTTLGAPVAVSSGIYYIALLPVSTVNLGISGFNPDDSAANNLSSIASEPVIEGKVTVTADTVPSTVTPGSITAEASNTIIVRLDN